MTRARECALLVAIGLVAACRPGPRADVVIYGPVWTGDPAHPSARAVAIRGDTIAAVGDSQTVAAMVGPETRVDHAPGLVMPGFIDDHVHFLQGGVQLTSVELRDAGSPAEFTRRIKEFASKAEPGSWPISWIPRCRATRRSLRPAAAAR